ncbi:MAG: hypothetical protein LBM28_00450 [Oscillospiraceae bacterium]|jgi:hypothetical protein|nr:hypothetical protein [Oscillospiraceae bacterium]
MLKKLLKYDMRANMKVFLLIWPALIIFSLLGRFSLTADLQGRLDTIFSTATIIVFVLAVFAAFLFSIVLAITRFYSGLLRNEGYLMFTLPVKPWQLIISKYLTSLITIVVTALLSVVSIFILCSGIPGFTADLHFFTAFMNREFHAGSYIMLALLMLAGVSTSIFQIYLACSIGQLFNKGRILFSALFYYLINVVLSVASTTFAIIFGTSRTLQEAVISIFEGMHIQTATFVALSISLLLSAALCCVYFFVTKYILSKRLNLE